MCKPKMMVLFGLAFAFCLRFVLFDTVSPGVTQINLNLESLHFQPLSAGLTLAPHVTIHFLSM